jgi:hypothetical protein
MIKWKKDGSTLRSVDGAYSISKIRKIDRSFAFIPCHHALSLIFPDERRLGADSLAVVDSLEKAKMVCENHSQHI